MSRHDTIVARASAPGFSLRALIRLSGPDAFSVLGEVSGRALDANTRRCFPTVLHVDTPLSVLAAMFPGPHSYTGEDVVELQVPGNPALVERIIRRFTLRESGGGGGGSGVRLAHPGEFTARAYLAGKLTLAQAEGIAATIAAVNDEQLAAASQLTSGATGAVYASWAEELTTLLALVEAGIDFTDQEDVVAISPAALRDRLAAMKQGIIAFLGDAKAAEHVDALPRVALVGRPNAGKSTLFNALLGGVMNRAVVSATPGTTRDVIEEPLNLGADIPGGVVVILQDLAGFDEALSVGAAGALDAAGQAAAKNTVAAADVILWCDPSGRFEAGHLPAEARTAGAARVIRVRTFGDQVQSPGTASEHASAITVCALDRYNLPILRRAIADATTGSRRLALADLLPRHRRALAQTLAAIAPALAAAEAGAAVGRIHHPEEVADSLRSGLDSLGELVGDISPDDVLGRVFSTFCVGK